MVQLVIATNRIYLEMYRIWMGFFKYIQSQHDFTVHVWSLEPDDPDFQHELNRWATVPITIHTISTVPYPEWIHVYAWKAHIIHETLNHAEEGNVVMYIDVGVFIYNSPDPFINTCIHSGKSLFITDPDHVNSTWTNEECRTVMNCTDDELAVNQLLAGIQCHVVNSSSIRLIREWKKWCDNPLACVGSRSNHRHDQSILSILVQRPDYNETVVLVSKWNLFNWDRFDTNNKITPFISRVAFFNRQN